MATEASIVKKYEIADRDERVSIMLANFSSFETQLDIEMEGIEYTVKEDHSHRRCYSIEELGCRVQTSSSNYSPTEAKAIENMEIERALQNHDFENPIFNHIVGVDEIRRDIYAIEIMRMDFSIFKKQLLILKPLDRKMLMRLYSDGADYSTIAEEEAIDQDSVRTRVYRARTRVKNNMFLFWDNHSRRGL